MALGEDGKFFFVGYIQAHGAIPTPADQIQTRSSAVQYPDDITLTVLNIPGNGYVSGSMGPMKKHLDDKPHWHYKSTELVFPGVLRDVFKDKCDKFKCIEDITDAFLEGTEEIKRVYDAAMITFPEGGFTIQTNPRDHQWWKMKGSPGENDRKTDSQLPKRGAADYYQVMPNGAYGLGCVCSNHPVLKQLSFTTITDEEVAQITHDGKLVTDFIDPKFFPGRNMIGHNFNGKALGANEWIKAIVATGMEQTLQDEAKLIIDKAYRDKSLHLQHFITVLRALNIGHAWLYNPTCRDLCEGGKNGTEPPSPCRHKIPDSGTTYEPSQPSSQSQPSSPSPPPQSPATGGSWWSSLFSFKSANPHHSTTSSVEGEIPMEMSPPEAPNSISPPELMRIPVTLSNDDPSNGQRAARARARSRSHSPKYAGSRKSRKRTTVRRKKITRKTKKRSYKKKSQKRNRRK